VGKAERRDGIASRIDLAKAVHRSRNFADKHKVPHSYSRAEENARFVDGVRDDEIIKDYIILEPLYRPK
jgi:hypothetical protein